MGLLSFLFGGCDKQFTSQAPQASGKTHQSLALVAPPEVTSESEDGFHDLIFYIREHKKLSDGSQAIDGVGLYKGKTIGLQVVLGSTWKEGSIGKNVPLVTYQGFVKYRSTGSDSDSFLETLDGLYETKLSVHSMNAETSFTGISLKGDPRDLSKGPVKIKLFFESGKEQEYAELYTNIELNKRRLEVHEKDPEYRKAVVTALRKG